MSVEGYTRDELYNLATEADITGRSDMKKDELREALSSEAPHLLDPFSQVHDAEVGDVVSMNHLSTNLAVTGIAVYDGDEVELRTADEVSTEDADTTSRIEVVLETSRGGRHKLVSHKGDVFGKNGEAAHLERWRAGDKEWMNNSTDPVYFNLISDDDEEEDDDSS